MDAAPEDRQRQRRRTRALVEEVEIKELRSRGLDQATCEHFGYGIGERRGRACHVAPFYHPTTGKLIAQKIRYEGKEFEALGDIKNAGLFGQQLWEGRGKMIVVTEGELDAMSVSMAQGNKWPVVSVKSGTGTALADLKHASEWLLGYDRIVLMFDQDKPGQDCAQKCADLFPPGRACIARLPLNDANEMLQARRAPEVVNAVWRSKPYRPDGVLTVDDVWERYLERRKSRFHVDFGWGFLDQMTEGLELNELVTICGGTHCGKSTIARHMAIRLAEEGQCVGYMSLEEQVELTMLYLAGVKMGRLVHRRQPTASDEELVQALDPLRERLLFYSSEGNLDSRSILGKMRYMIQAMGCRFLILDHLTIVISGEDGGDEGDRKRIDRFISQLVALKKELEVTIILLCHLAKPPKGKSFEEGRITRLSDLRGSSLIGAYSEGVLGLERDQQSTTDKNILRVRSLKWRRTGETGLAGALAFDTQTGRLSEEHEFQFDDEPDDTPF